MAETALFFGLTRDPHLSEVADRLESLGTKTLILDPTDPFEISFNPDRSQQIEIKQQTWGISAVWWRWKPGLLTRLRQECTALVFDDQTEAEWLAATKGIWRCNSKVAVNDFTGSLIYNNKISQLDLASSIGFKTPATRICNSKNTCKQLIDKGDWIIKPLTPALYTTPDQGDQPYNTATLDLNAVESCSAAEHRANASFIQSRIDRKSEIRANFIFGEIFARRFIPETVYNFDPEVHADWRPLYNYSGPVGDRGEPVTLPKSVVEKIFRYAEKSGLRLL